MFPTQLPTRTNRWALIALLVALGAFLLVITGSGTAGAMNATRTGGTGGGMAVARVINPAPPPDAPLPGTETHSPAASASNTGAPQQVPAQGGAASTPAASTPTARTPSAQDKKALDLVDFWWDVIVLAMGETDGTKLRDVQLKKPEVKVVSASSCPQPASNLLGPKSKASLTYCGGKLELVPNVFLTITDAGQLKVVASGFLYHALATTTGAQRGNHSNLYVLGCLQAGLVHALLKYQAISTPEDAWVVISPVSMGQELHSGYLDTMDQNGRWA